MAHHYSLSLDLKGSVPLLSAFFIPLPLNIRMFICNPLPARLAFISALVSASLIGHLKPVQAQALLPYTLPLDEARLEADGLSLAEDAAQLTQFQQYDEALARAQLAAQLAPNDPQVLALLGSLYLQVGDAAPAITALERAKTLQPNNALVWFALGSAYFSEAQYLQAADALESGLEIESDNAGAWFDLGNTYYKLNRYRQAISQYESAVENDATFWPAINNIGLVLYELGDVEGAISKWQDSLDIAEDEPEPQLAIAVARYAQGNQKLEAIQSATAALERDSRYSKIDFLEENLWGERLLGATQDLLDTPAIQELLTQLHSGSHSHSH